MKSISPVFILTLLSFTTFSQKTVFENSDGKETATYQQTIAYYQQLDKQFPEVKVEEIGMTDAGLPLHLVTVSTTRVFDYDKIHSNGSYVIMINNGIHPGEPDGVDACMMLVRDYLSDKKKKVQLANITLAIIPIYNVGGALNRNSHSRTNQNGPLEYGFRGNAKNLDLNRDFVKMDSKNAETFAQIYHKVNPDILIDTHVSNGADYQYNITHLATQPDKLGGELGKYLRNEMIPGIEDKMATKNVEIIPYVNIFNKPPDKEGYSQFLDYARFASGYAALFGTIGFTTETHMLKPYKPRVEATYTFIETMIEIAQADGEKIKAMKDAAQAENLVGKPYPISWKLDKGNPRQLQFKGYEAEYKTSAVTGFDRLFYNREKPFEKTIPYYNHYAIDQEVVVPAAYIIPQAWQEVIARLKTNNVEMRQFETDTTIMVEAYRIEDYKTSQQAYEAHYPHNSTTVSTNTQELNFRKGDYLVPMNQVAARYLLEMLEPQSPDSFFNWNFFDTILQQKEYFSPYVFEEIAEELLKNNADLKARYEKRKAEDAEFAKNWYAQLAYIYHNSPHYETAHLQYPVYRVMP